jgi:hypothetical protein
MGGASFLNKEKSLLMDLLFAQLAQSPHPPQIDSSSPSHLFLLSSGSPQLHSNFHQSLQKELSLGRAKNEKNIALIWEKI